MFKRLLQMLLLCAGLLVVAPEAPAAPFGLAAAVPQALDPATVAVRGGWHWRRFWRRYRRSHHWRGYRRHRYGYYRRHGRERGFEARPRERLRFDLDRGAPRRDAAPAPAPTPAPAPAPAPKSPAPKLY